MLLLAVVPARAHFVFLIPSEPDAAGNSVRMVFSDNLEPDPNPKLLAKITQTELFTRNGDGKVEAVKHGIDKDAIKANVPGTGDLPGGRHLQVRGDPARRDRAVPAGVPSQDLRRPVAQGQVAQAAVRVV